jgi:hypothetical protein
MTATWDDGMVWNIAGLTVKRWRAKCEAKRRPKTEQLWEGTHHSSHNKLLLSQRTDRGLLLSFFEQGRQICSFPVKLFGPLPEPQPGAVPKNNETLQKAVDFLTPLCEGYATGQIVDGVELKKIRDEKLKELRHLGQQRSTRPHKAKNNPFKLDHITSQLPPAEQSLPDEPGAGMKRETNKKDTGVDKNTMQGAASGGGVKPAASEAKKERAKSCVEHTEDSDHLKQAMRVKAQYIKHVGAAVALIERIESGESYT